MQIYTTDTIEPTQTFTSIGLVRGNVIRAKHIGNDIIASLRNLVGGEVHEYTKLMAEAREQAMDRMIKQANQLDADAIVGVKFATAMVMNGASEILVYGTAVRFEK